MKHGMLAFDPFNKNFSTILSLSSSTSFTLDLTEQSCAKNLLFSNVLKKLQKYNRITKMWYQSTNAQTIDTYAQTILLQSA